MLLLVFACSLTLSCEVYEKRKIVVVENDILKLDLTGKEQVKGENFAIDNRGLGIGFEKQPSFAEIDIEVYNSEELNISFWFNVKSEVQNIPQILFSLEDSLYLGNRFTIWMAGHRITGAVNAQNLWAKEYDFTQGTSAKYFDLFQLEQGKYYFFSMNVEKRSIKIYLNAELYVSYNNLDIDDLSFQKIIFGVERRNQKPQNQMTGYIRNLTLFDRILTKDEIYSLSVESYSEIEKYNREYELSKFNFNDVE
jgi:hypothetical protein